MKIMITGANGQVGIDLLELLIMQDIQVYANFRDKKNQKFLKHKNIKWIKHDFQNILKRRIKIDILINCIASHNFSKKKNFSDYMNSNIIAVKNIKKFAILNKVKLILNLSTISVYGKIKVNKLKENYIPDKPCELGITKLTGERVLDNSVNFINLRLPGVLTSSANYTRPWLKNLIYKLKKNKKIIVSNYERKFNNLIDTVDIVRFINHILKYKLYKNKINKDFNLSASNPIKLSQIINLIKENYLSKSKLMIKKNNMPSYIIDNTKIINTFKFYPSSVKDIVLRNLK